MVVAKPLRIKIISMGNAEVGKSCLIKRYCEKRFVSKVSRIISPSELLGRTDDRTNRSIDEPTGGRTLLLSCFDASRNEICLP